MPIGRIAHTRHLLLVGVSAVCLWMPEASAQTAAAVETSTPAQIAPEAIQTQAPQTAEVAPDSTATPEQASEQEKDIVVTGSRIGRSGFTTPTPVTVINSEQLVKSAPSTLAESLRNLPALTATSGPQRASGTQGGGQSFLNLRNLGAVRTLTLLDGRRFVAASQFGTVDVNLLPAGLIQRVDIVTGGASAAYGSDAVAGVVNFVLDTKYEGLKGEVSSGISSEGDNAEKRAILTGGISTAGDRLHLIASAEYYKNDGILEGKRDWARRGTNLINGPAGGPSQILAEDVRNLGTYGGTLLTGNGGTAAQNALFRGLQFGPGGTVLRYSFGSYATSTSRSAVTASTPSCSRRSTARSNAGRPSAVPNMTSPRICPCSARRPMAGPTRAIRPRPIATRCRTRSPSAVTMPICRSKSARCLAPIRP
jgi:outer membrane receptor protein involved in Fe transport